MHNEKRNSDNHRWVKQVTHVRFTTGTLQFCIFVSTSCLNDFWAVVFLFWKRDLKPFAPWDQPINELFWAIWVSVKGNACDGLSSNHFFSDISNSTNWRIPCSVRHLRMGGPCFCNLWVISSLHKQHVAKYYS